MPENASEASAQTARARASNKGNDTEIAKAIARSVNPGETIMRAITDPRIGWIEPTFQPLGYQPAKERPKLSQWVRRQPLVVGVEIRFHSPAGCERPGAAILGAQPGWRAHHARLPSRQDPGAVVVPQGQHPGLNHRR